MSFLINLPAFLSRKLLLYVEISLPILIFHLQWCLQYFLLSWSLIWSEPDVEKLIKVSSSKSCASDPLPTWMVKQCLPVLLPFITSIVNLSLSTSTVPNQFKSAVITPILKKTSLDPNILKNFRPVANLRFISKVVEKPLLCKFQHTWRRMVWMTSTSQLTKIATVRRQHFFVSRMIYWWVSIVAALFFFSC